MERVTSTVIEEEAPTRPIGWWLKEADAQLNAAFGTALHGAGVDRRGWQVLASLSRGPMRRVALVESLASFDTPTVVDQVVDPLWSRGWVEESAELLLLTDAGARQHDVLAPLVDASRATR